MAEGLEPGRTADFTSRMGVSLGVPGGESGGWHDGTSIDRGPRPPDPPYTPEKLSLMPSNFAECVALCVVGMYATIAVIVGCAVVSVNGVLVGGAAILAAVLVSVAMIGLVCWLELRRDR